MNALLMGLRQLRRDWRAGELTVLALALTLAVACVSSVNFFTDRIHLALESQANDLLGGDLVLASSNPVPAAFKTRATQLGVHLAETVEFPSMVLAGERTQLAALKAVSEAYPLRGHARIAHALFAPDEPIAGGPPPGKVWVHGRLLSELGIEVGATVTVGAATLQVDAVLASEPDQSEGMLFNLAPRLMMNLADLPATGLVQPASRVRYRLLMAGEAAAIQSFRQEWQPRLQPGEQLVDVKDARPQVRTALDRGEKFLGLAALVSVLLAGAAVALAARRFVSRHLDNCAVMRCLGAEQRFINRLYLSQMLWLGLLASMLGVLLGYLAQGGLVIVLGPLAGVELPPPGARPVLWGMLTGMITLIGFALPPILQLAGVPTLRVLRRDMGRVRPNTVLAYGTALGAMLILVILQARDITLAAIVFFGLLLIVLLLGLLSLLLLRLLRSLKTRADDTWRFGLMNIGRRPAQSVIQMVGFGIGLMALLLLAVVRSDLLDEWEGRLPADAPNRFLINIQPDQLPAVRQFFAGEGIAAPKFFPMVRARLIAINGKAVNEESFANQHARQMVSREFNLSWASELQADNQIISGRWWNENDHGRAWLSVEQGLAKDLGLAMGDTLTYSAGGQEFSAGIVSLRSVEWDSFKPNFFVLAPPGLLEEFPASYITAFYLPSERYTVLNDLIQQFPNITVLDVAAILDQVRRIIERVTLAVEYVFIFTVLAGLMVMYAAIYATLDERIREAAILRTLGARRGQLLGSLVVEYVGLGFLSGLAAAISAGVVGVVVAQRVFELTYVPGPTLWLGGMLLGAVGVGLAGTLGTRFVVDQPPLRTLRGD
ncbi:MAG: FtsX-like permease family protein [Pseudomonadota bacterium]